MEANAVQVVRDALDLETALANIGTLIIVLTLCG